MKLPMIGAHKDHKKQITIRWSDWHLAVTKLRRRPKIIQLRVVKSEDVNGGAVEAWVEIRACPTDKPQKVEGDVAARSFALCHHKGRLVKVTPPPTAIAELTHQLVLDAVAES